MTAGMFVEGAGPGHAVELARGDERVRPADHRGEEGLSPPPDDLQPVLTIRGTVDPCDVPSFVRAALHEIRSHIEDRHLPVQGPPFSICRPVSSRGVDVEVGWPVGRACGGGRVAAGALPADLLRRSRHAAGRGGAAHPA